MCSHCHFFKTKLRIKVYGFKEKILITPTMMGGAKKYVPLIPYTSMVFFYATTFLFAKHDYHATPK
jgi:hypothetical protein